jgi:release factor glutamine methyltransferase
MATTVAQALALLHAQGLERLDAQLLTLHALEQAPHDRAWLLAHDTDRVPASALARLQSLAQRRLRGEPVAYLTGHKAFYGLHLAVDARVLVPRPDTETLVDWALEILANKSAASVVDLGTGSGAIALALKHARPDLQVHAVDFSADALAVARANAQHFQLAVEFRHDAWLTGAAGSFDAIVSNPPYIAAHDPHLAALQHEPLQALASGSDGLADIRVIISQARPHLKPGGWLLLEHGFDQAQRVCELLQRAGFVQVTTRRDLAGIERCSAAALP